MVLQPLNQVLKTSPILEQLVNKEMPDNVVPFGNKALSKVQQRLNQSNKIRLVKLMKHKLQIQIPTTINVDQPYDTKAYVELAHNLFTKRFGGSSSKDLFGWYQTNDFRLVNERMIEVEVWMTEAELVQYWSEIEDFVWLLLNELQQETVIIVVDNAAALFEKDSDSASVMAA